MPYSLTISRDLQELVARFEPPILEGLASRVEAAHISSHRFSVSVACKQYISVILMGPGPQVNLNPINIQTPGESTRDIPKSTSNFSCFYMVSSCTVSFRNTVVFGDISFFSSKHTILKIPRMNVIKYYPFYHVHKKFLGLRAVK